MKLLSKKGVLYTIISAAVIAGALALYLKSVRAESLPNTEAPAGFALTKFADGLNVPTAARFSPDGRIFVIEKSGAVKIVKNGQLLTEPFFIVPNVNDYVDRGLLGLALDPDFATNGHVYLLYTYDNNPSDIAGPKTGRLIRVTANGDTAIPGSAVSILGTNVGTSVDTSCSDYPKSSDCLPADGLSHAPGALEFGPDKKLYVTIGDAAGYDDLDPTALNAQDIDNLAGKILRINRDGTAPVDNPYFTGDPAANRSKVFAYGVRNAFRMTIRPSDGLVMVGDVGWNTWEEVNVVTKGSNLGWPCYEARDQQNGTGAPNIGAYKDLPFCQQMYAQPPSNLNWPISYYPHPPSSAIISGVFYSGSNYPAEYNGRYFYGDYAKNQIYNMQLAPDNTMTPGSHNVFASNAGGPVNFFTGPDGDIYYVAINMGGIYHISYSTNNRAPNAFASADVTYGPSPLEVKFTSNGTSDPEGDALTYSWDFGDDSPIVNGAATEHTFTSDGTYEVTLTVTDSYNNSDTKTVTIYAGKSAPIVTIASPLDMTVAEPDQVINFSGSATDTRDGILTGESLKWQVVIHHCPLDSCHIHNVQTITGASGSITFPHHDGPFYIQITLTATNSTGLASSKYVSVWPTGQDITGSIQFDGINDYAVATQSQDFELQNFSAEAMIKTLTTDDWGSEILSAGNNWSVRVTPVGNVQFSFWSNGSWQNLIADVSIKDGLWHHVAVTKTLNAMKIYVDGELVAQNENSNSIQYIYGKNFIVGRHGDGDDHFSFNGSIDEVRVWSSPRSDAAIAQYHTTTLPEDRVNLTAYYMTDEGNGLTAADHSPSASHPITLMDGATWTAGAPLSSPTPTPPAPGNTPISTFKDSFTGASIDGSKWNVYPHTGQLTQNELVTIAPTPNAIGYYGMASKNRYELKDNAIFVEVPKVTSPSTTAETQLLLELDPLNNITVGTTGNSLHLRHRVNGVNSDTFKTYDAASMRWWRIREAANIIYWETSPDRTTWTEQRQTTKAFPVNNLLVILQAGTWQAVTSPGTAQFDNLNAVPAVQPPPSATNNSLNVNGSSTGEARISGSNHKHYTYQTLTIEAWVKTQATGIWGGEVVSNGNNYGVRILPDGNIRFFTHTGNFIWQNYETTDVNMKDGVWHHTAVTRDDASVNIYIDGALRKSFPAPSQVAYTLGNDFVVGRHGDNDNNFNLTGQVDDLRLWNVARTGEQIANNYRVEAIGSAAGLTARWLFNGDVTTWLKESVDGHDLTAGSGATQSTGNTY